MLSEDNHSGFNNGMVSSKRNDWETPAEVFDYFNKIFNFDLDAAASYENTKCRQFFTEKDNALERDWPTYGERVWLNPPYGKGMSRWITKAQQEADKGPLVVCLLKHATETKWWDTIIESQATVIRIRGRIKFSGNKVNAPFPAVVVIFWPHRGLNLLK